MTHCDRVLGLLADGEPHSYLEGYRLGVMLPVPAWVAGVSDLRKRGHIIECWRDGDDYLYQLQDSGTEPSGQRSSPGSVAPVDGSPAGEVGPLPASPSVPVQLALVEAA